MACWQEIAYTEVAEPATTDGLRTALASVGKRTKPFVIDVPTSLKTSFRDIVQSLAGDRWKQGE